MGHSTLLNGLVFKLTSVLWREEVSHAQVLAFISIVNDFTDASYWTQGYVTTHMCTPSFLSHLSQPILTCGKALNLLRVCLPKV